MRQEALGPTLLLRPETPYLVTDSSDTMVRRSKDTRRRRGTRGRVLRPSVQESTLPVVTLERRDL